MSETAAPKRKRRGARAAMHAMRAAKLPDDQQPVQPGMSGGRYQPLTQPEVQRIHEAVLDVLENIGLSQAIPSCVEIVTKAGGKVNSEGRLTFPRALVEDHIANAARNIVLPGQDPKHDLDVSGSKVYFGTAGAAVHIVDTETREYPESTLADLYDIARLVDALDHIHFFQRPLVARDMVEPIDLDVNTCYASVTGTAKHVGTSWVLPEHLEATMPMLHAIAGGEKAWRERPFVSMSNCFVVPPLRFAEDACRVLEVGGSGRDADPFARGRPGGRHQPGGPGWRGGAGSSRSVGRSGLRQFDLAQSPVHFRHLAFRIRPPHGRDEWRQRRASGTHGGLWSNGPVL